MFFEIMINILSDAMENGKTELTQTELVERVSQEAVEKAAKMLKNSSVPGFKTYQDGDTFKISRAFEI